MARSNGPKGRDLPIEGAAEPSLTVLKLLEEMRLERARDEQFYKDAELRERVVLGDMMPGDARVSAEQVTAAPDLREPMHENVIMPALQTLVARIDQGRIDAKCWPHTPTPARIAGAEGGNLILDSERQRQRRDMKVHESLFWSLTHGDAGVYTLWDDAYGPVEAIEPVLDDDGMQTFDEQGFPVQKVVEEYGGIRCEVLCTFDFWTSGEDNIEDMRWQVRRRIVDRWTAKAALDAAGILRDVAEINWPTRVPGRVKRGVEVLELWVKPGAMIKPGLHAVVVDGQATKSIPYPLPHKRLPISIVTCMRVFDTPHGHTVTKDGISQQRLVDVSLRSITRRADIAGDARLLGVDALIDGIDSEREGRIKIDGDVKPSDAGHWLTGAEIPRGLVEVYSLAKAALQDVMGVSAESVTGGDPTSTTSGEQLKTAAALDAQKIVPIRRRAEVAWEEVDRQVIELWRAKASKPRLASVVGDPVRAMYLQGADLDGVDVAIESASGLAMSHSGKARTAEEQVAAGQVDPVTGAMRAQTGTVDTVLDGETKQRLEAQAVSAMRNVPQMPLPGVDGAAAARFLRMIVARAPAGRTASLLQLIAMYEQSIGPPMGTPAAQGGQPQVTPSSAPTEPTASPEVMQ